MLRAVPSQTVVCRHLTHNRQPPNCYHSVELFIHHPHAYLLTFVLGQGHFKRGELIKYPIFCSILIMISYFVKSYTTQSTFSATMLLVCHFNDIVLHVLSICICISLDTNANKFFYVSDSELDFQHPGSIFNVLIERYTIKANLVIIGTITLHVLSLIVISVCP